MTANFMHIIKKNIQIPGKLTITKQLQIINVDPKFIHEKEPLSVCNKTAILMKYIGQVKTIYNKFKLLSYFQ